jgi:hypothetical protein
MLLPGALFVLFLTGCWLYCLTDAVLAPAAEHRGLPKSAWVCLITLTYVIGAVAWLIVSRRNREPRAPRAPRPPKSRRTTRESWPTGSSLAWAEEDFRWTAADDIFARHPAGRSLPFPESETPKGPDDDPEFLHALDILINGTDDR